MPTTRITAIAALALPLAAAPLAAQLPDTGELQARERAVWQAVQAHDTAAFRKFMTPEYGALYPTGPVDLDGEVQGLPQMRLKQYELTEFEARPLAPGRVLVTYKVTMSGTANGDDLSGTYWAASIWRRDGNRWVGVFHTEMKAQ